MFSFALLRYPIWLSIGLGAIAGLAAGTIAAFWSPEEDGEPIKAEKDAANDQAAAAKLTPKKHFQKYGVGRLKHHRHPTTAQRRFSWLFRKK
jgi:hypothetical protein